MSLNRRSFLALLSAALTVKPAELIKATVEPPRDSGGPVWMHWNVWDTIRIQPNQLTDDSTFFPPLPKNFFIESIRVGMDMSATSDDLTKILDTALLSVHSDGLLFVESPLYAFGLDGLDLIRVREDSGRLPLVLRPRDNFRVALNAAAVPITRPCDVTVMLAGRVMVAD